ncbi:MAG TPA: sortase [Candidatus Saccharimonadia bacterium]|nr:sortase [Candidatus Saccharimonadia bacterium]
MADPSDTLNIGSLRLRKEYPIAQTQIQRDPESAKHPAAAAAARARIAALPEFAALSELHPAVAGPMLATPAPTADLVTSKSKLADEARTKPLVRGRRLPSAVIPFLTAAGVFLLVLLLFKAPVIINQINYSLSNKPAAPVTTTNPAADIIPAENTLTIAKIGVHSPVIYEPSIQEAAIQRALQDGVVHYGNTALPGANGNVAIFGHSSNDWWEPGDHKFEFVLLDKLTVGDQVSLDYQSKRYIYEVTGARVVEPTEVSVLNPTATPTLTLITCSPPGTSLRRLVVTAKQINPDPTKTAVAATTPAAQATPATLTSSSPGFLDQLVQAWKGIFSGLPSLFGGGSSPSPSPAPAGQIPNVK